jgi:Protein of unknown function (DUF2924)
VPGGFSWRDETYASLSAIAQAITGTSWNGPRFFGLRGTSDLDVPHGATGSLVGGPRLFGCAGSLCSITVLPQLESLISTN